MGCRWASALFNDIHLTFEKTIQWNNIVKYLINFSSLRGLISPRLSNVGIPREKKHSIYSKWVLVFITKWFLFTKVMKTRFVDKAILLVGVSHQCWYGLFIYIKLGFLVLIDLDLMCSLMLPCLVRYIRECLNCAWIFQLL